MNVSVQEKERAKARMKAGCAHLFEGRFDVGWEEYEARHVYSVPGATMPQPLWRGESLEGKSILVHREQGIGDEIWFASCFPDLLERCGRAYLTCDLRVGELFGRSFPGATILTGQPFVNDRARWRRMEVDYQVPAGNLGRYFRCSRSMFPATRGYLVPDSGRRASWRRYLGDLGPGAKVGISWQGGGNLLDLRQAPWDVWRGILAAEGVRFVNLQCRASSAVVESLRRLWNVDVHVLPGLDLMNDLDELAAVVSALDLVISVPNTTVHVAGAVGVPTWVLHSAGWGCFWILNGEEIPWYPSARVFPRSTSEGWEPAREAVCRGLAELAASGSRAGRTDAG